MGVKEALKALLLVVKGTVQAERSINNNNGTEV
jgi:hypothetical protein